MIGHTKLTATVPGPPVEDEYGNLIPGPSTTTTVWGDFWPLTGDEPAGQNRDLIITRFRVAMPPSAADLTAFSKLTIFGQEYELLGDPEPHNVHGRIHHYEVVVKRAAG